MSALTFTLKKNPLFKVDCSQLTPDKLKNLSIKQILEITLNNNTKVIDLFEVSGNENADIIFKKSHANLDYIGHQMQGGQIAVEGDCGVFLGANMRGGTIICHGNSGDRVGDQMRRGTILVEGNAGDYAGSRMVAGTIGILGKTGAYTGYAMKRGTILLNEMPSLHATIQDCSTHDLPFLSLLFKSFPSNSFFAKLTSTRVQRFAGDLSVNGNGEILVLQV